MGDIGLQYEPFTIESRYTRITNFANFTLMAIWGMQIPNMLGYLYQEIWTYLP